MRHTTRCPPQDAEQYAAGLDEAELQHKRRSVAAAEASWLKALEAKAAAAAAAAAGGGAGGAAPRRGWGMVSLQSLMDSVLGNLQLVLTNVHVRYEDDGWAWAGHRLAVGVLLGRVAAHTVDEQGQPAFVTANVLLLLRKVGAALVWGAGRSGGCARVGSRHVYQLVARAGSQPASHLAAGWCTLLTSLPAPSPPPSPRAGRHAVPPGRVLRRGPPGHGAATWRRAVGAAEPQ